MASYFGRMFGVTPKVSALSLYLDFDRITFVNLSSSDFFGDYRFTTSCGN